MKLNGAPRRILLIRRKAMGDALVTWPAVTRVAAAWPGASLDLVLDRPFVPLFSGPARGVKILAWPPPAGQSWLRSLRERRYDLVIDWLGSPRTAMWTALSGARWRVGYDLPRRRWAYNIKVPRNRAAGFPLRGFAGEAFLDPLRELGLDPLPWRAQAPRTEWDTNGLGADFRRWRAARHPGAVVLMMSATWSAKAWPNAHIIALYRGLEARAHGPLVVTGPGDEAMESELRKVLPAEAFAPPTSLPELACLLLESRLFVGTDNGARHLAASLGLPTVTLFGPTDPGGWNPPGPRHVSVCNRVACAPCDLTRCPVAGHPCLDELLPEQVLEAVERSLGAKPTAALDKPKEY